LKVYIEDKELIRLYTTGNSKKLRLPGSVVEKFLATVQKIESAVTIHDLWKNAGLNFEKLKGFKDRYSMRLTGKYRLETEIKWINEGKTIGDFLLITISSHYGD